MTKKELIINDLQYLINYYRIRVHINKFWESPYGFYINSNIYKNKRITIFAYTYVNGSFGSNIFNREGLTVFNLIQHTTKDL